MVSLAFDRAGSDDSRNAAGASFARKAVRPPAATENRILRPGGGQGLDYAERMRLAVNCLRGGRSYHQRKLKVRKMTSRDIPTLLAILACVLAATVLTWWLSMKTIEYFLQGG